MGKGGKGKGRELRRIDYGVVDRIRKAMVQSPDNDLWKEFYYLINGYEYHTASKDCSFWGKGECEDGAYCGFRHPPFGKYGMSRMFSDMPENHIDHAIYSGTVYDVRDIVSYRGDDQKFDVQSAILKWNKTFQDNQYSNLEELLIKERVTRIVQVVVVPHQRFGGILRATQY